MYDLSTVPTELIADELEFYNSAVSFVTTGHDLDGERHIFLASHNPGRNPPIYAFSELPFTMLLGPSPVSQRLAAVVYGLLVVVLLFFLVRQMTQRDDVALLAALFAAVAPIFVHFSRIAWQPACEVPFLLAGLYGLARGLGIGETDHGKAPLRRNWLIAGAVLLGLTAYTYMAGWFYALVLGGALLALEALFAPSAQHRRAAILAYGLALLVAAPALYEIFIDPETAVRTTRIATFRYGLTIDALRAFASNYLSHFRWSYLAVTGDPIPATTWRYLNGMGAFYWWLVPLAVIGGIVSFACVRGKVWWWFLWIWLLVYPLGGSLTDEGAPNAPRTLGGAPVFCVFAAIGAAMLLQGLWRVRPAWLGRPAAVVCAAGLTAAAGISTGRFAAFYFTQYVHQSSNAWDSGTATMFAVLKANLHGHQVICFNVRPAWYGLDVYEQYYLAGLKLDLYPTIALDQCKENDALVVTDTDDPPADPNIRRFATIYDVDGNKFAYIGRVKL